MRRPCRPAALLAGTQRRATRKPGTRSLPPTGGGEDVAAGPLRDGKVCLQLTDNEGRQPDGSPTGTRLGRAGDRLAFDLGEAFGHGDRPRQQIDAALAEPGQLSHPQATVGADEHQYPLAGMNGLGQVNDLGG
jgi:hypothetical protein